MPSNPPPPQPKKGLSGCMIAVLVAIPAVIVIAILAALAVPAFNIVQKKAREAKATAQATTPPAKPFDDARQKRAMEFAAALGRDVRQKNEEAMSQFINTEAFTARVFAGTSLPFNARAGFSSAIKEKKGGLLTQLAGSRMTMLRFRQRDGFPAVTMRVEPVGGGVNYIDLLVHEDGDSFKVVDLYGYLFGSWSSAESRQAMVLMQEQDTSSIAQVLGISGGDKKSIDLLMNMFRQMGNRDPRSVQHTYEQLPPALQKSRPAFTANLQALQQLQSLPEYSPIYAHALENAGTILGKDAATDLLLVDLYFINKDYTGVKRCMANVRKAVGPDAYLDHLEGIAAIRAQDYKAAEASLAAAEKLDPDLTALVDLRMQVRAAKGDFAGVITELKRFISDTGARLTPEVFDEPVYDALKKSPEFKEWAESLRK